MVLLRNKLSKQVDSLAADGLRTLVLGHKWIKKEDFEKWSVKMQRMEAMQEEQAKKTLPNMIDDTIDEIEHDIDLIGATAIEQAAKDVPDTIASLAVAGIKIWILTGDKQDTAINIGFACQLLRQDMDLHIVNGTMATKAAEARKVTPSTMHDILRRLSKKLDNLPKNGSPEQALVIDGVALEVIFHDSIHCQTVTLVKTINLNF